jgi:dipeptidyl aminopeptidase/acylaminoacyl peptidase
MLTVVAIGPIQAGSDFGATRPLGLDDLSNLRNVADPRISPDGDWVAYTVTSIDAARDRNNSDLWMTSWDGARTVQLTHTPESEHTPHWSPDGRWLGFLSGRSGAKGTDQLWLLDRNGGEAECVTDLEGGVSDFAWSPDAKRLVLVSEVAPDGGPAMDRPQPIVVDRFQFKGAGTGYLGGARSHLVLLDLATRREEILTPGPFDELMPAWSPDGSAITFVSKRGDDPDRTSNWDLWLIEPRAGAEARRLTATPEMECDPEWGWGTPPVFSPDGSLVAFLQAGAPELTWFSLQQVATIPAASGPVELPTRTLDRNTTTPRWSRDGSHLYFLLEDDQSVVLARVPSAGGAVARLTGPGRTVYGYDVGPGDRIAVLSSTPDRPAEIAALEKGVLRPISTQNDAWLAGVELGATEEIRFRAADGTEIHGLVVKPPGYENGRRYPTLLRIHGGPVAQYQTDFSFDWQLFAANGYVVVGANPRGSSGRGEAFQRVIFNDWGNVDVGDVLAAVDSAVAAGIADPERLGVGGWSYGAMLTNYVIASDRRFRAATSGAGVSNMLAGYGTDAWVRDWEIEVGLPWEHPENWLRLSYPFLHADRITTPTLFLCGTDDVTVPLIHSEQMYQALSRLGVPTELVIYPGETHGISRPSFQRDRLQRYLEWYGKWLGNPGTDVDREEIR